MRKRHRLLAWVLASALMFAGVSQLPVQAAGTVYAGGNGSSENSGTDALSPLDSLYSAQDLLPEGGTIEVTSTIYVSGERTYSLNEGVTLKAADTLEGPVFKIAEGGKLVLNNIVIIGNESVLISNSGVLHANNGTSLQVAGTTTGVGCVYTGSEASTYVDGELVAGIPQKTPETESEQKESETGQTETQQSEQQETQSSQTETQQSEISETAQTEESETQSPQTEETSGESQESETAQTDSSQSETQETQSIQPETQQSEVHQETETAKTDIQESEVQETETQQSESQQAEEHQTETDPVQDENDNGAVMTQAVIQFDKAAIALSVHSRDDVQKVVEVSKVYDALSTGEKAAVSPKTLKLLESAQQMAAAYNQTQLGVSVYGNLPWYVQFQVSLLDVSQEEEKGLKILVPYELKLWNLYDNESYTLPKGEKVTVTMPIPDIEIDGEFTIFHYKSDGSLETIKPVIKGNLMSFETDSFSPFSVAGSTVLAGIGIGSGTSGNSGNDSNTQNTENSGSADTSSGGSSSGGNTTYTNSNTNRTSVNTGDMTQSIPYAVTGLIALLAMAAGIMYKRKE